MNLNTGAQPEVLFNTRTIPPGILNRCLSEVAVVVVHFALDKSVKLVQHIFVSSSGFHLISITLQLEFRLIISKDLCSVASTSRTSGGNGNDPYHTSLLRVKRPPMTPPSKSPLR